MPAVAPVAVRRLSCERRRHPVLAGGRPARVCLRRLSVCVGTLRLPVARRSNGGAPRDIVRAACGSSRPSRSSSSRTTKRSAIDARIENLLALDYPAASAARSSSAPTDPPTTRSSARVATQSAASACSAFDRRRGKPAVLNALVPHASRRDRAVRRCAAAVRAVHAARAGGELRRPGGGRRQRRAGARAGERHGACRPRRGVLLALRKVHPLGGKPRRFHRRRHRRDLRDPARAVRADPRRHDPRRRAHPAAHRAAGIPGAVRAAAHAPTTRASATAQQEFARKARTIAGTFQLFARERWLFNPRRNRLWFETMSHKGLRLVLPVLHAAAFAANIAAAGIWPYQWLLRCSGLVLCRRTRRRFAAPTARIESSSSPSRTRCVCCAGRTFVGFYRFVTNRQPVTWERLPVSLSAGSDARQPGRRVAA